MNKRIGTYIAQNDSNGEYRAYIPAKLPPKPDIDLDKLDHYLEKANLALNELNSAHNAIPDVVRRIYMYKCKEALLSSQIEGTQSSFSDLMLFEHNQNPEVPIEDVEEVSNYIKAINHGLNQLKSKDGLPLCLRLLKEMHGILLSGGRGSNQSPGEFRKSQNWIGGTRQGNAIFIPPPVDRLEDCLHDFEKFLYNTDFPVPIKAGLAHVQFETIHPFLDGNGRLGRLLITLILCADKALEEPILYLSIYLKQNRNIYYKLLQEVREFGTWEVWLEFFLIGVEKSSKQATEAATRINDLFIEDDEKISHLKRARSSCEKVLEYMKELPQVTAPFLAEKLKMTQPVARRALNHLKSIGILTETSNKKRNKVYIYRKYLDILEDGTEPFPA